MKKKVIITSVVSFVLLLLVVLAGINAVYTVTDVRADFRTFSAEGEREAKEIQEKLDAFVGSSSVFLDLAECKAIVDEYPCFRLVQAEKKYPDVIEVSVSERKEAFAFELEDGGYAILDEDGGYLFNKATNENRMGGENILLSGFVFSVDGEEVTGDYFSELGAIIGVLRASLDEVRSNVLAINLVHAGDAGTSKNDYVSFLMQEGVVIDLYNPHVNASEKARLALDKYMGTGSYEGDGLTDMEKVQGTVTVIDDGDEGVKLDYKA